MSTRQRVTSRDNEDDCRAGVVTEVRNDEGGGGGEKWAGWREGKGVDCAGLGVQADAGVGEEEGQVSGSSFWNSQCSLFPPHLGTGCLLLLTGRFPPFHPNSSARRPRITSPRGSPIAVSVQQEGGGTLLLE